VKLIEYLEPLGYDIAFWLTAFQNPDYPIRQLGEVSIQVSGKLRAAAIIALLTKGSSDAFYHNLIRSARARVAYLERLESAGVTDDHHQASGRVDPFLDAVAAADFDSARRIVALSLREWLQGHEYEDDFCYAQIVHGLITVPTDVTRLQQVFERYEQTLDGVADARLDVTRAIARRDQAAFDEAFEALLARHTRQIEAEKARRKIEEPVMMAERQVYVEGLALLQIATRLKFATQNEYQYCPSLARVPMQKPFPGE
jgi:immunity protein 49 of polymorphic toxin system